MINDQKHLFLPISLERIIRPFLKQVQVHHSTVRQIIHKWKAAANLHRNGGHEVLRENAQKMKTSSEDCRGLT